MGARVGGASRDGTLPGGYKINFLSPCRHLSHAQGCHLSQRECQRATLRPLVHERPPVTGPAQGGQWPRRLCDLQPVPPASAPLMQGKGKLCSGLRLSSPRGPSSASLHTGNPGGLGWELWGLEADLRGIPTTPGQVPNGLPPGPGLLLARALPAPPAHTLCFTKAPCTLAGRTLTQGILWGTEWISS